MSTRRLFAFIILLRATFAPAAEVFLTDEHLDIIPRYVSGQLTNIAILNEFPPGQIEASNAVLVVKEQAKFIIPQGLPPAFAPLGNPGAPLWILPQDQDTDLLFVGIDGGEIPSTTRLRLLSVEAQCRTNAQFILWQGEGPNFFINTRDGISSSDHVDVFAGSHNHFNWGFSTSGIHRVTFQATNTSLMLTSPPTTFLFHVLPLAPFETFQTNNWASIAPLEIVSPTADPDGDGIPNLAEFAHATDPNHAGATNLPVYVLVNVTGTNYGAVQFVRNKTATDTVMTAEMAPAPDGPWSTMTNLVSLVDQGATELVTYRDVVPVSMATNRYGRVNVEWRP